MPDFDDGRDETELPGGTTVETDVLIVGSGPAGGAAALALALATLGVANIMITKYRWTANTPRAHITNQRAMEIFRDLGIEDQVLADATPHALVGDTVFCTSIAGEEIGRIRTWGTHPAREADYQLASPCLICDIPQTYLEPILVKNAAARVIQPGSDVGGIGAGLVRMVRPWNEWLIVWGYEISQPAPVVDDEAAAKIVRNLLGLPDLDVEITGTSLWGNNEMYATRLHQGRVFCAGDAVHRHPPSNGLGSNTSVQDSYNLAWKLAAVLRGYAGPGLLDTYSAERAPVAKQIVLRANQSSREFGQFFEVLGLTGRHRPGPQGHRHLLRLGARPRGRSGRCPASQA
jgi:2-polyprenyl-6-methoxyphenol hydroxylase-like FAD-dependent oxidoreductase